MKDLINKLKNRLGIKLDSNTNKEKISTKEVNPIVDFVQSIVFALVICLFVYLFIAMPNQIEGNSMNPNFHNNEIILTSKVQQWLGGTALGRSINLDYQRGDVIVFQKPGFADFIKRVIGLPGERIRLKEGYIYINDRKLVEDYIQGIYSIGGDFIKNNGEERTISLNHFLVMGDNRGDSHDSRYSDIGFIDRSWMKGKVILRYWPLNALQGITAGNSKLE